MSIAKFAQSPIAKTILKEKAVWNIVRITNGTGHFPPPGIIYAIQ